MILLGREQQQVLGLRARQQIARLGRRVAMMVGKRLPRGNNDAGLAERCKEFFRIGDPGEGEDSATDERGSVCGSGSIRP